MWETRSIEKKLLERLKQEFSPSEAESLWADYVCVRKALADQVLPEIKAVEPTLTKHDASHVANVLDNVEQLLGEELTRIPSFDLYILCVCVLFHDAGNISGRERHNQEISKVYQAIKEKAVRSRPEQAIVQRVAGAHTGKAKDGTRDTLKDVPAEMPLGGKKVQTQWIAAVLRLADELAEGPQRASWYMMEEGRYGQGSAIHHVHAQCLDLCIDRGEGRIALTYDFNISVTDQSTVVQKTANHETLLSELLEFTYGRIVKLDIERKYTKHYCDWLVPFKTISVTLRFWRGDSELALDLNPLTLSDLVIPGEQGKRIDQLDKSYGADQLIGKVLSLATQAR